MKPRLGGDEASPPGKAGLPCRSLRILVVWICLLWPSICPGDEIATQFGAISFSDRKLLLLFNENLSFGHFQYLLRGKRALHVEDEVRNKLETAVEQTKIVLEMFPESLSFHIVLLGTDDEVQRAYREMYNRHTDFIAFYSPQKKAVYLPVNRINLRILVHELAHVVIDHYFGVAPPMKIHEVLAQYAESHFEKE